MTTEVEKISQREILDELQKELFELTLAQVQAWMALSHALMNESSVSQETREAAKSAFEKIDQMIVVLEKFSDLGPKIARMRTNE